MDEAIEPITKLLGEVKTRWFEALDMQQSVERVDVKLDQKMTKMQMTRNEVSDLIDAISVYVQSHQIAELNG